jgi:predicted ATPase
METAASYLYPPPLPNVSRRYIPGALLGVGSMGIVYAATDRLTGTQVALKCVTADGERWRGASTATDGTQPRLLLANEFQTLASLRHPNIISVLDYGFDAERQPYIIEELLRDPLTFREAALGQPLAVQAGLLVQILRALTYLHRRGVIHRDLKPSNVMVVGGQVKVLDFGLAILRAEAGSHDDSVSGTLSYIAPEILLGAAPGELSDLYAVGVMAYEVFTGRHPFPSENAAVLVQHILTSEIDVSGVDVDAPVRAVLGRLLARSPEARFQSAEAAASALAQAAGLPMPEETRAIRDSFLQAAQFVGRERELRQLTDALDETLVGQGSVWLVSGESGVGKSRLLNELRTRALVKGAMVLSGQAVSEGRAAYGVWRDTVRTLAVLADLDTLELSILKQVAPEIPFLLERVLPDAPVLDAAAAQTRLFTTVSAALERLGQPVVIVLEDLQWAGDEDLALLRWLSRQTSHLPLLILANARDDERSELPELLPEAQLLHLERLSENAIATLSASMLGDAGRDPAVVSLLQRETEGNVYFLVEVVRTLAEEAGRLAHIGQTSLPGQVFSGGVQQVVQRRLGRLPGAAQPLLRLAAVLGRQIDLQLLSVITSPEYLDEWLVTAATVGILSVQNDVWRFDHDKLREGVLVALTDDERRAIHKQAAELIERFYGNDPRQVAALAYHWNAAGEPERERPYAVRAGIEALLVSTFDEALIYLERALSLQYDPMVQHSLAEAYAGLSEYDRAEALYQQNLTLWREANDARGISRSLRGLGAVAEARGDYAAAEVYLAESLAICREINHKAGIAWVLESLSNAAYRLGNYPQAEVLAQEALDTNSAIGQPVGVANSLKLLGSISAARGDYPAAQDYFERSLAVYRETGQKRGISACLNNLGLIAATLGEYELARTYSYQSLEIKTQIGDRRGRASTLNNLGIITHQLGEFAESRRVLEECLAICAVIGDRQGVADATLNLGRALFGLHEIDEAEQLFLSSYDQFVILSDPSGTAIAMLNLGRVARVRGKNDVAESTFKRGLKVAYDIDKAQTQCELMVELAFLRMERGQPEAAVALLATSYNHPANDHEYRSQATSLLNMLRGLLPEDVFESGMARFATLDEAVAALLAGDAGAD